MSFIQAIIWIVFLILILLVAMSFATTGGVLGGYDGGGVFRFKVGDPQYGQSYKGDRVVDIRFDTAPFNKLKVGQSVMVVRARPQGDTSEFKEGPYKFHAKITDITPYSSFSKIPTDIVEKAYPSLASKDAKLRFEEFVPSSVSDPKTHKVLAFTLKKEADPKVGRGYSPYDDDIYGGMHHELNKISGEYY